MERLCSIMGRCHEVVNKVESLYGMRNEIQQMEQASNKILTQIDRTKQNYDVLQLQLKKFTDQSDVKQNTNNEIIRHLTAVT